MALGGAAWRACLQAGFRRALSFLHPAPGDKKKGKRRREKEGTEEKKGRRRGEPAAPSASPVSFKSDKCAAGNMTEKNNAEGPRRSGERVTAKGLSREGARGGGGGGGGRERVIADWGWRNRKTNIRLRGPFVSYCFGRQAPRRLSLA